MRTRVDVCIQRQVSGYTLYDHKTNDYIRRELRITGILDKIYEYRRNWLSHLQRIPQNRIPLKSYHYIQTTRKENNWKTEEALERAAGTVETERIKGSNPWCLWWWWWWRLKYMWTILTNKNYIYTKMEGSLNLRIAQNHSVQNILDSHLLSTHVKMKIKS